MSKMLRKPFSPTSWRGLCPPRREVGFLPSFAQVYVGLSDLDKGAAPDSTEEQSPTLQAGGRKRRLRETSSVDFYGKQNSQWLRGWLGNNGTQKNIHITHRAAALRQASWVVLDSTVLTRRNSWQRGRTVTLNKDPTGGLDGLRAMGPPTVANTPASTRKVLLRFSS